MFFTRHDAGGIAKRSKLLASGLAARGWRVHVIARATELRRFRLVRSSNLTILEVPGFGHDRAAALLYLACGVPVGLTWGLRASAFLSIKLFSSATAAALCSGALRRPFVALATTSGPMGEVASLLGATKIAERDRGLSLRQLGLDARRRLLCRATFLVAQTPTAAHELNRLVPTHRIATIPTPVEQVEAPRLNGGRRALFAGRLSKDKDLVTLLQAWTVVVAQRPDAQLTLAGAGGQHEPVEGELRRIVAGDELLLSTVKFTGWVPDVRPLLVESDVFVFPSLPLQEGMSNALLEACAWGRVVVASDIPANRAVVGDEYPLLFPPGNSGALAVALLRAFEDEETRKEVRTQVTDRAATFSIDSVLERLEQLVEMAIDRR